MRAHLLDCNCQACLLRELDGLKRQINTPEIVDFAKAVQIEAAHQRERWGAEHDVGKTDADWFWLIGYIAGKALHGPGNTPERQLHRIVTIAAVAANWHLYKTGRAKEPSMRPGIETPKGEP